MNDQDWRTRLAAGIKANKLSQRKVSLAAGNAPGYVNSLIKDGKDPTMENLLRICEAAGLSFNYVVFGLDIDRETEEIIRLAKSSTPARRQALLELLRQDHQPESAQ